MIVNVNPYDTGYDENSHVMRFAAIAREVQINNAPAPVRNMPALPPAAPKPSSKKAPTLPIRMPSKLKEVHRRQVTICSGGKGGRVLSQTQLEVLEGESRSGLQVSVSVTFAVGLTNRFFRGRRARRR